MPSQLFEMLVRMDDGGEHDVVADQRDLAKWEVQDFAGDRPVLQVRFLAWSALSRQGVYRQPWDRFNNVDCVEVVDKVEPPTDGEGEQGPRPPKRGRRTPPAES